MTIQPNNVPTFSELDDSLGLPVFVKPARQGSSVGVSKVETSADYGAAVTNGFLHDDVLLAEESIEGREIECSVLEKVNGDLFVSRPGEIVTAEHHGFYSYEAKYIDADGATIRVPAQLPEIVGHSMRQLADRAFRALGCDGMARVDFFVTSDFRLLVNEVNTIPGFTDISMYAKAMAASGISYPEVLDRLIDHGLQRAMTDQTKAASA
jgi:D-alanine-D-alanine ligase